MKQPCARLVFAINLNRALIATEETVARHIFQFNGHVERCFGLLRLLLLLYLYRGCFPMSSNFMRRQSFSPPYGEMCAAPKFVRALSYRRR